MVKIFLFRTGSVSSNENIFLGWLNPPLNKKGIKDAQTIAKKLKKEKIDFAFCSNQLRGKQALVEALKYHKNAKVIIDVRLRERNYGIFSGQSKELFKKYFPKTYFEIKRSYHGKIPNGENFHDVSQRVFNFMNDLIKFMHSNEGDVLICAHNNSVRLIRTYLEDLQKTETEKIELCSSIVKEYEVVLH